MVAVTRSILPSADLEATAAFYAPLGFRVAGSWPEEYLILAGPDDIELHFWYDRAVDRWTNDVACWIGYPSTAEVRARYDAWAAVGVPDPATLQPPRDDGRLLEFDLVDLHGNLLRVGALTKQG
jgi:catechol 2,3-dioxygenase-like lactoylglutathione lyase family enzyme